MTSTIREVDEWHASVDRRSRSPTLNLMDNMLLWMVKLPPLNLMDSTSGW